MQIRRAEQEDRDFVIEMAVLACGLEDRPLPAPEDEAVLALLPGPADLALIATGEGGTHRRRLVALPRAAATGR